MKSAVGIAPYNFKISSVDIDSRLEPGNHSPTHHSFSQLPLGLLNLLKTHVLARFTLQMVEQPSQRNELFRTSGRFIQAMIYLLLTNRRVEMLV